LMCEFIIIVKNCYYNFNSIDDTPNHLINDIFLTFVDNWYGCL